MGDTRLYPDCKHGLKGRYVNGVLTFSGVDRAPGSPEADPRQGTGIGVRYVFTSYNVQQQAVVDAGDMRGMVVDFNVMGNLQFYSTAIRGVVTVGAGFSARNPRGVYGGLVISAALARVQGTGAAIYGNVTSQTAAHNTGQIAVANLQWNCSALGTFSNNANASFIRFSLSGDAGATGSFDDLGHLFDLQGFTEGTGNIFSAGADVAAAATLRIVVGATHYYIMLAAGEST